MCNIHIHISTTILSNKQPGGAARRIFLRIVRMFASGTRSSMTVVPSRTRVTRARTPDSAGCSSTGAATSSARGRVVLAHNLPQAAILSCQLGRVGDGRVIGLYMGHTTTHQ